MDDYDADDDDSSTADNDWIWTFFSWFSGSQIIFNFFFAAAWKLQI